MHVIQQSVHVDFRYPVHFTSGLLELSNPLLRDLLTPPRDGAAVRVLWVVDAGVLAAHPQLPAAIRAYGAACSRDVLFADEVLVVPGGEAVKNDPSNVDRVHGAIHAHRIDRHSYVVAVGGGAVLDMVGYAAATAHRGVRLIRVPTTVLAQNDSGVGVKNSMNAFDQKNFLGCFAPPAAVLNDSSFLATLDDRDWRGGLAEAVKVALIRDGALFDQLERDADALGRRELPAMEASIVWCAELHLAHIATAGDPFEHGSARPLDFGHWAAHKLERLTHSRLRHGEAVAIGIALDTTYACLAGVLDVASHERIFTLLRRLGFDLYDTALGAVDADGTLRVLRGLEEFREHLGGRLTITLPATIGRAVEVHDIDHARMAASVAWLRDRSDLSDLEDPSSCPTTLAAAH